MPRLVDEKDLSSCDSDAGSADDISAMPSSVEASPQLMPCAESVPTSPGTYDSETGVRQSTKAGHALKRPFELDSEFKISSEKLDSFDATQLHVRKQARREHSNQAMLLQTRNLLAAARRSIIMEVEVE